MIDGHRVLALVPARRGSKGLPLKNVRPLHGKPLLAWPIEAARASRHVDRVVLSTDDAGFAEVGRAAGADVPFLRPAELAGDHAPSIGFILHALDALEAAGERFDYLVLLEPTSPLTQAEDIDAALESLHAAVPRAQALVGVSEIVGAHPAFAVRIAVDGLLQPYAAGAFDQLPRRQDIEKLFALDGSLYISTVAALRERRGFCHGATLPYVTPKYKSLEIDDLVDFICVEALAAQRALLEPAPPSPWSTAS
jgi:N-acylneuraminate cytidylyltransferase/CMP-N,N'-diacetyllegionaminic acid synthase